MRAVLAVDGDTDRETQKDLFRQVLAITKEQFYAIGTLRIPERYGIVKNNSHHVPTTMLDSAVFTMPAMSNTCQFSIEE